MPDRYAADASTAEVAPAEAPVEPVGESVEELTEPEVDEVEAPTTEVLPAESTEFLPAEPSARPARHQPAVVEAVGGWLRAAALVIPTALLIGAALFFWIAAGPGGQSKQTRDTVLRVARQDAVNFATYDYRHLDSDFALVANASTGTFHNQFLQSTKALAPTFRQFKAIATGTVQDAGIVQLSKNHAVVLVYVDQVVQNANRPQASTGRFRFEVDLARVHGQWLISNLAPV